MSLALPSPCPAEFSSLRRRQRRQRLGGQGLRIGRRTRQRLGGQGLRIGRRTRQRLGGQGFRQGLRMSRQPGRRHGVRIQRTLRQQEKCLVQSHVLSLHGMPNVPQIGQPALRFDGNIGSSRRQVFRAEQVRNGFGGGGAGSPATAWLVVSVAGGGGVGTAGSATADGAVMTSAATPLSAQHPAIDNALVLMLTGHLLGVLPYRDATRTFNVSLRFVTTPRWKPRTGDATAPPRRGRTRFTWEFPEHAAPCPNCGVAMLYGH